MSFAGWHNAKFCQQRAVETQREEGSWSHSAGSPAPGSCRAVVSSSQSFLYRHTSVNSLSREPRSWISSKPHPPVWHHQQLVRWREGGWGKREKHRLAASWTCQNRPEPATWVCALTRNRTHKLLVYGTMLQPTKPHQPGLPVLIN